MNHNFYSAPSSMSGGYIVYGGYRRQRGAGFRASFRNFMAPIKTQAASFAKQAGKQAVRGIKALARNETVRNIAKTAATKGAEVLTGVAVDALHGRDAGESFRERSRQAALDVLTGKEEPTQTNRRTQKRKLTRTPSTSVAVLKQSQASVTPSAKTSFVRAPRKKKRRLF